MKHLFILLTVSLTFAFAFQMNAQTIVSTEPMNRTIVLESFTAVNNYNVSYINNIIEELRKKHTDQFIVINIHDGEDAIPKSGQPDFRTQYGTRIADLLDGHAPRGSFNRERSPNIDDPSGSTGIAVRSTYWELSAAEVAAEISPVNIAVRSEWIDRETIEIKIEAYFTDNCEPGCLLNVALIENGVVGYQEGPVDNPNFVHNNILRDLVTGQWGEDIKMNAKGDFYEKTFAYKPGEKFSIYDRNYDIVAFITKPSRTHIYSGASTDVVIPFETTMELKGKPAMAFLEDQAVEGEIILTNNFDKDVSYSLSIEKTNSTPADWTVEITDPLESSITVSAGQSKLIKYIVNPGATRGYSLVNIIAQEEDTKYDFAFKNKFGVISDEYEHLMINTAAENETIPDAVAKNTSPYYGIVILPGDVFEIFAAELSNLKTLLWDNGTKGVFTPGHAAAITHSVDSGVDIALLGAMTAFELDKTAVLSSLGLELKGQTYHGYDFWNIDVYDYDVVGISGDPISGKLGYVTSCLQAQLIPICSITNKKTTSAFIRCAEEDWLKVGEERYILAAKDATFGFRYEKGEQKVVYMTESPSLFINEQKSAELTEKILDYLSDFISVEEFDNTVRNIKAAPNPFAATTTVEFSMFSAAVAEMSIVDVYGNLTEDLGSKLLPAGRNTETINFRYPASGVYFFLVKSAGQTQQIKLIISK